MNSTDIKKALASKHHKDFCITECKSGPTWGNNNMLKMDFVAIKKSWAKPCISVYEVKTSRNDFLSDDKWPGYLKFCDCFYFASPKGVVLKKDIDALGVHGVGLVHVSDNGFVRTVVKALHRQQQYDPDFLLYIIMNAVDSDRLPFYSDKADYLQGWLDNKKENWVLGRMVGTALAKRLSAAQNKIDNLESDLLWNGDKEFVECVKKELGIKDKWGVQRLAKQLKEIERLPNGLKTIDDILQLLRDIRKVTETCE